MPAPGTAAIPAGTLVTAPQMQAALTAEKSKADADQRAEEIRTKAALRKLEREAQSQSAEAIARVQDKADEIAADAIVKADDRSSRLATLSESIAQAERDIEARRSAFENVVQLVGGAAQASGIPFVSQGGALLLGLGGVLFGAKKHADAKSEESASKAHDEAWEESKKELLALMQMVAHKPPQ